MHDRERRWLRWRRVFRRERWGLTTGPKVLIQQLQPSSSGHRPWAGDGAYAKKSRLSRSSVTPHCSSSCHSSLYKPVTQNKMEDFFSLFFRTMRFCFKVSSYFFGTLYGAVSAAWFWIYTRENFNGLFIFTSWTLKILYMFL